MADHHGLYIMIEIPKGRNFSTLFLSQPILWRHFGLRWRLFPCEDRMYQSFFEQISFCVQIV